MGSDVPVTHRYQCIPELTKNSPARNFRTLVLARWQPKKSVTLLTKERIRQNLINVVRPPSGKMTIHTPTGGRTLTMEFSHDAPDIETRTELVANAGGGD
jgi:hypothetical protein